MEFDLRHIFRIARRRGWLILLIMAIGGATAFGVSSRQDNQYAATATLQVLPGRTSVSENEFSAIQASRSIAETYRLLIKTGPVLDRVVDELDLPYDATKLNEKISTSIVGETQLIEVRVVDGDPERAAQIATTVVEQFQEHLDERVDARIAEDRETLDAQITDIEADRDEISSQIDELEASDNADEPETQDQIDSLNEELDRIEQSLSDLRASGLAINTGVNALSARVEVVDPAQVPDDPFEPRPLFSTALGLFVGLLLGVGLVALLEFMDNTIKPEMNIQELAGAPVLATISQIARLQPGGGQVYTMSMPRSSATEAMRLLRTNLDFASASGDIGSLVITSPGPGEGKSTVTANLGVVMAQAGVKTVIVDADLRKPTQNRIFGIPNDRGLTTLITHPDESWEDYAKKVALPNLWLVPSGPVPPNPSDLVSSDRFTRALRALKDDVDLVLIDSPPILSASDSLAIATTTDGMMLVCRSHQTRIDSVRHAASAAHQGGIRLVGVVLNRLKGQRGASYYGEYYGPDTGSATPTPGD